MAKQLKAIQCPKCGSTQYAEIRPDLFRCASCGTEFYLDNDDININVRQVPPAPAPALVSPASKGSALGSVVFLGLVALVIFGIYQLVQHLSAGASPAAETVAYPRPASRPDRWDSPQSALFLTPSQQPVHVLMGTRENDSGDIQNGSYAGFYNAATGTELKTLALPSQPADAPAGLTLKQFSNGSLYVLRGTTVYQLDAATLTLADVTKTLFEGQPTLASGLANIGTGNDEDDSFYLFTNDGHNVNYYPLIHQLYTNDELGQAKYGFKSLRPGSTVQTGFAFSRPSLTYPEDNIQLITYQYRDNGAGPKDKPNFTWDDDYGGSGIFTDADPHRKVLISPYWVRMDRLLSFRDFTPGRLYFDAALVYYDADYVLLTFRPTAASNSPTNLQCLNARTGAIVFTLPLPDAGRLPQALRYSTGFIVGNGQHTYTISLSGTLLKRVDIQ